ncbi:MAG: hypothetical protein IPM56_02910 [Ignavibacteriales bacterium]|nr:MAG: hypothetical protein IPM56_02910 [Ignavibacteriales bacterium]
MFKRLNSIVRIGCIALLIIIQSCGNENSDSGNHDGNLNVANLPDKDAQIQRYNLSIKKEQALSRTVCDTIALTEYILDTYPPGTYLVDLDKTLTYNIPSSAVIYSDKYIFAVIASSKPGERLIDTKNIVGFDQSYIDLDSTKLGTAFFYLVLFECDNGKFKTIWEAPVPSHGGFNTLSMEKWNYQNTPYIRLNFHYAQGVGHIDYNYFLVNGITSMPHLLMTYKGLRFQRTITNANNDIYPDYYEYVFYESDKKIAVHDSVVFLWNMKDSLYFNPRNPHQTRSY